MSAWGILVAGTRLHLAVSYGRSEIFLNFERFVHYGPCPTVCDCLTVYQASFNRSGEKIIKNQGWKLIKDH